MSRTDFIKKSDEELVSLAAKGHKDAEDILCERYKNVVRIETRPYFLIGADNDDLLQEGMIGLFKAIRNYSPDYESSFSSFARLCIKRHIISVVRKAAGFKHAPLNSYISLYHPVGDDDGDSGVLMDILVSDTELSPEELLLRDEEKSSLYSLMQSNLSSFEYSVAELFLQGLSYNDIAKTLNRDTKPVDNALQRIRKKLEKVLTQ